MCNNRLLGPIHPRKVLYICPDKILGLVWYIFDIAIVAGAARFDTKQTWEGQYNKIRQVNNHGALVCCTLFIPS